MDGSKRLVRYIDVKVSRSVFFASHRNRNQENSKLLKEQRERLQVHGEERRQAENTARAEQLVRDAKEKEEIKKAWIRVIQAEDHLMRNSATFIPKVRLEETNPTFKHPENWNSLGLQDKAKLIIADQAVKLLELQCHEYTARHQEDGEPNKHRTGLPGAKRDWQGHIKVNDKLQHLSKDMWEGGECDKEVFAQELGNTNQIEYRKETRLLTTKPSKEASSSPTKATKPDLKGSNSTIYSNHKEHKMVTPQKAFLPQTKLGQGEENSRLITPNAPDQQNIYKSTCGRYNEDIVNITSSDNDESKNDNESISSSTSYSAGMHTSGDDTDGQDIPDLIDTDEDDNTKTRNSEKYWGFLSAPMGLAVSPAR